MRTWMKLALIALAVAPVAATGCSHQASAPDDGSTRVDGTVVSIDDAIPRDGDATIMLVRDDGGGDVRAYLPSLFTNPPPSDESMAIHARVYPVILQLEVGDRVVAQGIITEGGLRLEELSIQ